MTTSMDDADLAITFQSHLTFFGVVDFEKVYGKAFEWVSFLRKFSFQTIRTFEIKARGFSFNFPVLSDLKLNQLHEISPYLKL